MIRCMLVVLSVLVMWSCPNPETGKVDPYLTARTIINQAPIGVAVASSIFNQWLAGQTDVEKAKKAEATFEKISTGVINGLQLALNGVAIAEQAKKDPNITDLMKEADDAWDNLRKFLGDLLAKSEDTALTKATAAPSSQPATVTTEDGVGKKTYALTAKNPLDILPKKLH